MKDGNFDLMTADGGFGLFDACADGVEPMFNSTASKWGAQYGGVSNVAQCNQLPQYPVCSYNAPQDNLRNLCLFSFQNNIRGTSNTVNSNPSITAMCQVACPSELYTATGLHRSDENPNLGYTCNANSRYEATGGYLTRMMDCGEEFNKIKEKTFYLAFAIGFNCFVVVLFFCHCHHYIFLK